MNAINHRPGTLQDTPTGYCPGCGHSLISRLIAEVVEEMGLAEDLVLFFPIGCSVQSRNVFNLDMGSGLHGRTCSVATGFKRVRPQQPVIVYQGDGDAVAIGLSETTHAAARGEAITVIMVNNSIYGMTGGQMSPTTLVGQVTTTSQHGRDAATMGYPIKMAELIAGLDAPAYVTRQMITDPKSVKQTKKAIKKALQLQVEKHAYSFIEILSNCPVGWKMSPQESMDYIKTVAVKEFPIGDLKGKEV